MNELPAWGTVVAGIVSVITMVVSRKVLKDERSPLSHPVIPVCVGLMAFIGLCKLGKDSAGWLLLPYVALAVSIVLILMFLPFLNKYGGSDEQGRRASGREKNVSNRDLKQAETRAHGRRGETKLPEAQDDLNDDREKPCRRSCSKANEMKGKRP